MNNIILTVMRYLDNPKSVSEKEHDSNMVYANSVVIPCDFGSAATTKAIASAAAAAAANGNYPTANKWVEEYFTRSGEDKGVYYEAVKIYTPLVSIEEKLEGQLIANGMTQESAKIFIGRVMAGDYVGLKWSGK